MRRQLLIICLLLTGCSTATTEAYRIPYGPLNFPLSEVEKDDRPGFSFDSRKPWRVEFGRGSGWHGLNTIKLSYNGEVVLRRLKVDAKASLWSTATGKLPREAVAKVADAIAANQLLGLEKAYHADVQDGTQWVLWIRQGDREKAVYFNNHFPDPIVRFAGQLDAILSETLSPDLEWHAVPAADARKHERELWDSTKR